MSIDSLGLEKIFADSSLSSISPAEMNFLAEKLPDTSLFAGLNLSYSKIDSLKSRWLRKLYFETRHWND